MKKIILLSLLATIMSCATTTIVDTKRFARVEDITASMSKNYKYKAVAWQYKPRIKKYIIKTDSLYRIGDWIEIKQ